MRWTQEQLADYQAKRRGGAIRPATVKPIIRQSRREYHDYKADFLDQLQLIGLPLPSHGQGCPNKELQFARPRLWRFDWAYENRMVAVEYQGGNYTGKGGHNTTKGLRDDYEKFTEAAIRGWLLVLIDCESVKDGRAITWTERALSERSLNGWSKYIKQEVLP